MVAKVSKRACPSCGEEMMLGSKVCPSCGAMVKKRKDESFKGFWVAVWIVMIILGIFLAYVILGYQGSSTPQ